MCVSLWPEGPLWWQMCVKFVIAGNVGAIACNAAIPSIISCTKFPHYKINAEFCPHQLYSVIKILTKFGAFYNIYYAKSHGFYIWFRVQVLRFLRDHPVPHLNFINDIFLLFWGFYLLNLLLNKKFNAILLNYIAGHCCVERKQELKINTFISVSSWCPKVHVWIRPKAAYIWTVLHRVEKYRYNIKNIVEKNL